MTSPEDRLRAATAAIREREHLVHVHQRLATDLMEHERRVQALRAEWQHERADVERVTTGVMGFLSTILGTDVAKEQREAAEAEARLHEAMGSVALLREQLRSIEARLAALVPAALDRELAAARAAQEEALRARGGADAAALQELAIQIESIDIELIPLADALAAGDAVLAPLAEILAALDAATETTYEGAAAYADRARALAGEAQARMLVFQRALGELAAPAAEEPEILDEGAFADAWVRALFGAGQPFDRLVTARADMAARLERVHARLAPLRARYHELAARRAERVRERDRIITG